MSPSTKGYAFCQTKRHDFPNEIRCGSITMTILGRHNAS